MSKKPNVIYVFADQWRLESTGFAGNPDVRTPNLDRLAAESVWVTHAVAGCPVCSPYRASLLTGQYPLSHGVFVNDVHLEHRVPSLADAFKDGGYSTAYIGKWHVNGRGRVDYIPPEDRQGFEYWKVLECTHNYNDSWYYAGDCDERLVWKGYDAIAQTDDAIDYIQKYDQNNPFMLVLSWGPPHSPMHTAPEEFRQLYDPEKISVRPNVPESKHERTRKDLAGYYAHCTALDSCIGKLWDAIVENGIEENTIFVFGSDHGDMIGSQGQHDKQQPYDESIRVPFLVHYPDELGREGHDCPALLDAPDIMPTLLGMAGLDIPDSVEGIDFSGMIRGGDDPSDGAALIMCPQPFGQWHRGKGGKEYRGLRTLRYTYVRDLNGPWLLFDNEKDPYQLHKLVDDPASAELLRKMDAWLQKRLDARGDAFRPGMDYIREWGYEVDETQTVPFGKWNG
ncbi:MAG: sulfatase [Candidatus Sumerlaeota bacterium]